MQDFYPGQWGTWGTARTTDAAHDTYKCSDSAEGTGPLMLRASSAEMARWGEGFDQDDVINAIHVAVASRVIADTEQSSKSAQRSFEEN